MWFVIGAVCFSMVEFLFVAGLFVQWAKRRQAEEGLRASRSEQQRLAGRMIEAQECERRRVARELHDDLNQGLALAAVELDLLAHQTPGVAGETAERLQQISARIKQLSSAVHALSHQLHPSRVEQLGLAAAVRGLCKELGQLHGLGVTFTDHGVPDVVPPAHALCLYRVTQEALRNVVRHAGTNHATVELTGTLAGIRLRVSDAGVGFDSASALRIGGLGLISMRERLHLVGGVLIVDARSGEGTRIDARIPAPPRQSAGAEGTSPICLAPNVPAPAGVPAASHRLRCECFEHRPHVGAAAPVVCRRTGGDSGPPATREGTVDTCCGAVT